MTKCKLYLLIMLGGSVLATPVLAQVSLSASINLAPPEERVEYMPEAPRSDVVWIPGYWNWMRGRYVWVGGRYAASRPGYFWVQDEWVQQGQQWQRERGHWQRQHFPDHNDDWRRSDERHDGQHDDNERHDNGRHEGRNKR